MRIRTIVFLILFLIVFYVGGVIGCTIWMMFGTSSIGKVDIGIFSKIGSRSDIQVELQDYIVENIPRDLKFGYKTAKEAFKTAEFDKLIIAGQEKIPSNYEDYKTKFCDYVLERIKAPKDNKVANVEEAEKLPGSPSSGLFRSTVRNWANISLILDSDGFDRESVLTAFAGYYFSRDMEKNFQCGGTLVSKIVAASLCKDVSNEIMRWASKPRKTSVDLNKMLAKDILKLVENDYPFARCFEFEAAIAKTYFKYLSKKGNILAFLASFGSGFKNSLDFYYGTDNKAFCEKPYYECHEELSRYNSEILKKTDLSFKMVEDVSGWINYAFSPVSNSRELTLAMFYPNFKKAKETNELSKARMELAAIALVYNGFYTDKGRIADSMTELEEWFGEKLPINRITGDPYKLHEKNGYVIYNIGIDGEEKLPTDRYSSADDFYFIFDQIN